MQRTYCALKGIYHSLLRYKFILSTSSLSLVFSLFKLQGLLYQTSKFKHDWSDLLPHFLSFLSLVNLHISDQLGENRANNRNRLRGIHVLKEVSVPSILNRVAS